MDQFCIDTLHFFNYIRHRFTGRSTLAVPSNMSSTPAACPYSCTFNLGADGRFFGHVPIPYSRDDAGWGDLMIPVISIRNGTGPCALIVAGNHGDEWEGQFAIRNVARELAPATVKGQVIFVPALNLPAVRNNSRCSPLDQLNMNRIFPGDLRGSITQKIAAFVYHELVRRADFVLDLHAGGRNIMCATYGMMHRYPDAQLSNRTLALMKAFGAPISLLFDAEPDREGMLDTAVEDLGKPFVAVELGGSGTVSAQSIAVATRGIHAVLSHAGITASVPPAAPPTRIMEIPANGFVRAADHGLFEPFVEIGALVRAGQPVGQLHSPHLPEREPLQHTVRCDGEVLVRRTTGLATHGDCVIAVGRAVAL
jgi:N-alpha-acetyl-L-2,4-diaminobutyrate deacetylase